MGLLMESCVGCGISHANHELTISYLLIIPVGIDALGHQEVMHVLIGEGRQLCCMHLEFILNFMGIVAIRAQLHVQLIMPGQVCR